MHYHLNIPLSVNLSYTTYLPTGSFCPGLPTIGARDFVPLPGASGLNMQSIRPLIHYVLGVLPGGKEA